MKRLLVVFVVVLFAGSAFVAECGQADYPKKGQSITIINPWAPGGASSLGARLLAMGLEKELGVPVLVADKPGASGQLGMTELAQSKPDGYTIAYSALMSVAMTYLDPGRKATFKRKDLAGVAAHVSDVRTIAVSAKSPYKTVKDLADAIKANPGKVKAATNGALTDMHFAELGFEKMAGGRLTYVHYRGSGESIPAVMGGHADTLFPSTSEVHSLAKSGEFRVLAILGKSESKFLPGVKTAEAQGYPIFFTTYRDLYVPAATPREIVNVLARAIRKVMDREEHRKKVEGEMGLALQFQGPDEMEKEWDATEKTVKELIPLARK